MSIHDRRATVGYIVWQIRYRNGRNNDVANPHAAMCRTSSTSKANLRLFAKIPEVTDRAVTEILQLNEWHAGGMLQEAASDG